MKDARVFIIWLSMISGFNELEIGTGEPKFVFEYRNLVSSSISDLTPEQKATMSPSMLRLSEELNMKERINLCNAAIKVAGARLDTLSPITEVPLRIYQSIEPVLQCPSMPVSYLKLIDIDENKWKIILNGDTVDKIHRFVLRRQRSKPMSCSDAASKLSSLIRLKCFDDQLVKISHLRDLRQRDFLRFCLTVQLAISKDDDLAHLVPSVSVREVDPPQTYNFGGVKRVAFQCQSTPPMYMYFEAPRVSKVVQVVLVVDE